MEKNLNIPHDLEIESMIINSCLYEVEALEHVICTLKPEDFYYAPYSVIFTFLKQMMEKEVKINKQSLFKEFEMRKDTLCLEAISLCRDECLHHSFLIEKIRELKEISLHRQVIQRLNKGISNFSGKGKVSQEDALVWGNEYMDFICGNSEKTYSSLKQINDKFESDGQDSFMECVQKRQEAFKNGTSVQSGIPTLFRDLDKIFGGFKAGHSIIIGARPGVGKTTIACNLIVNLCSVSDTPIGVFSLEMEKSELFSKIVFLHSEVDQRTFEDGSLNGERYQDLFLSSHKISKFPVFIDDTAGLNTALMYARAKLWKKKYDVKIIFIDYLQLLKAVGKFPNKNEEIGEVSRFLKKMAKDLKVCIVSLAQLNRDSEKNSRPISSDLRESGQIEQDADAIFMLHNPSSIDKYNKPGILEVCVTKNRFGKEGVVELIFNKETGKMRDQTNVVNPIQQKKQPEIDPYAQYTK